MRLHLHILRAHIGPFLFSFFTLLFIFLLQFVMKFIDQLIGKGLSGWVIAELIVLQLGWVVVLAVPMSVLVATLMAFGSLSSQNEITAMKAGGMSLYRMMSTVVAAAVILTVLTIGFNNEVLPEANHRAKMLLWDIRRTKPTLTIVPGLFSQDIAGYSILARKTFEKSNDLEGVVIYDYTDPSISTIVTAENGRVSFTPDYRKLVMDLYNGEIHQVGVETMEEYRRMRYNRHRMVMNAEGFDFERSGSGAFSRGDRELSAGEMEERIDSLQMIIDAARLKALEAPSSGIWYGSRIADPGIVPRDSVIRQRALLIAIAKARAIVNGVENQLLLIDYNRKQIDQFLVEIHKKYSIPAACIVFVFIGAPLGVMVRRGTFGIAASLSLGFFLIYWASLIGGEKLADRGILEPWIGMWMANIILGILGIYLTIRLARETPTIELGWTRRFVPKSFRTLGEPDSGGRAS